MTTFLRLLPDRDKGQALAAACSAFRRGASSSEHTFEVEPESFRSIPGAPFAYWIDDSTRSAFMRLPQLGVRATVGKGPDTGDDFRLLRLNWEIDRSERRWRDHPKGGRYSPFYADVYLTIDWINDGALIRLVGNMRNPGHMWRPGLTWSRRTKSALSMRVMPAGCVFADKGPALLVPSDDASNLLAMLGLCSSAAFHRLVEVRLAAADAGRTGGVAHSFEVGIIEKTPIPDLPSDVALEMARLTRCAWSIKRTLDSVDETSRAFVLPEAIRARVGDYDRSKLESDLASLEREINRIADQHFGFSGSQDAPLHEESSAKDLEGGDDELDDDETSVLAQEDGLLSWAVGVAFGRFDWRHAIGKRASTPEPEPFAALPERSPGMLPNGTEPFHANAGILVDDPGHSHDLVHQIEEVLVRVDTDVASDVRRWLQRDFFALHLQRYSKSRRKAPVYWPLSTMSGSYTLWVYYPSLTSQTLYKAVNDFLDGPSGKLREVGALVAALRNKGSGRSRDDERQFEALQAFELELTELRDSLLRFAPTYKPSHDDGVIVSAAPLWQLFRHKPWQKLLKDTWTKLEKGEYDWAHMALNYWPDRVREKCKNDKSFAIAHGLESLYVEPEASAKKTRGRKKGAEA